MTTKSEFRILGLAHKFCLAWEVAGGTAADLNKVAEDPVLMSKILLVARGLATAEMIAPIIDCDATPSIPTGYGLALPQDQMKRRVLGKLTLSPFLHEQRLSRAQRGGAPISGDFITKHCEDFRVLTANVLDCLLEHPAFIPDSWKGTRTHFFGTIYEGSQRHYFVRYLYWNGLRWGWDMHDLTADFGGLDPIAVLQAVR
jgi:hypothetical protein